MPLSIDQASVEIITAPIRACLSAALVDHPRVFLQRRRELLGLFLLGKGAGHTHHDSLGIATPQQTQLFRMRMLGKFVLYRCRCDKLTLVWF